MFSFWFIGEGEGGSFELSDHVPEGYLSAFARGEWVTEDSETGI